jgi:hypothetical protein
VASSGTSANLPRSGNIGTYDIGERLPASEVRRTSIASSGPSSRFRLLAYEWMPHGWRCSAPAEAPHGRSA